MHAPRIHTGPSQPSSGLAPADPNQSVSPATSITYIINQSTADVIQPPPCFSSVHVHVQLAPVCSQNLLGLCRGSALDGHGAQVVTTVVACAPAINVCFGNTIIVTWDNFAAAGEPIILSTARPKYWGASP